LDWGAEGSKQHLICVGCASRHNLGREERIQA
jgi:hypothetical protein